MSKSTKRVLGIAAAIVIPYAAPALVGAIATSGVLGATTSAALGTTWGTVAGSALAGAGLGAASSAALGQDWRQGALYGGIGGGVGGYFKGAGGTAGGAAGGAGGGVAGGTGATGTSAGGLKASGLSASDNAMLSGRPELAPANMSPVSAPAASTSATGGTTFTEALKGVPQAIADKFKDPKALADLTLKAAAQLAGSYAGEDVMSPEEQQLLDAQRVDLEMLRQQNQEAYNLKLNEAKNLISEANYFDPQYMGLQAARREQTRGGIQAAEALRGIREPDKRLSEMRKRELGTSRNVGTAYDSGYQQGVSSRIATRSAGINAIPNPTADASYGQLAQAYGDRYRRQQDASSAIGTFLGGLTGDYQSTKTGDEGKKLPDAYSGLVG